ncbi:hypothetical protein OUY22_02725 [Nonomuraea sp. MCN248]|uniref:MptD family ECF transporter S component n=1 Tax=Nonomuraea corallina TaxID=2989783 RepID=A0ABT4S552_9ACTN|nr:hypothetical protein [Nonomuraea corallina]MDA0632314.1 hypothetical protein [Nonomuraea corallina]
MRKTSSLGMSPVMIVGLALLGVPRVIAHDLGLVGPVINAVLTFLPVIVWLGVVLWRRVPNPFLTLLAIGGAYGVLLAVTHQLLWSAAFGEPPRLGGDLAGALAPGAEEALMRTFAFGSSVFTGILVGVLVGAVGWVLARAVPAARPSGGRRRSGA